MHTIVRAAALAWTPWKNGGGVMADIAASAARTPSGDPVWRVSMARVERDGAFSHFADVDRVMMLLAGEGLDLAVEGSGLLSVRVGEPAVSFPGDRPTRGLPIGGTVLNLNVMVHRESARARMILWRNAARAWLPAVPGGQTFAYVLSGSLSLADAPASRAEAGDTLVTDAPVEIVGSATLIEVAIWPLAGPLTAAA